MIWQGNGFLVPAFTIITYLLFQLALALSHGSLLITHNIVLVSLPAILAAAPIALIGYWLNQRISRILVDPRDGKKTYIKESHTFLWLPMHYWGGIIPFVAIALASRLYLV